MSLKTIAIMRHGEAVSHAASDRERELTHRGKQGCIAAATNLRDLLDGQRIDAIYHSPFIRTTQTANIVLQQSPTLWSWSGGEDNISACEQLIGSHTPDQVCDWLYSLDQQSDPELDQRLLLVSHQPLVSNLLSWLLEGDLKHGHQYPMSPASLAVVDAEVFDQGCGRLRSLVHASIRSY